MSRNKNTKSENVIQATPEGKLYITTEDFFKQEKIQNTIEKLLNSSIHKQLQQRKS